jgi:beta-lactamase regulating signal transducer with metallopeptidase domain
MISAVLDHLWQSTLLAVAIAALAVAFRNARASVRYGLWLTASLKFLVPFAAFAALGRLLAPAIRPPAEPGAALITLAAEPFARSGAPAVHAIAPLAHAAARIDLAPVLLGLWALGVAVVLVLWMTRWARIRPMVLQATPVALKAPMPVMTTQTMMEPGLVGLWRPVLLVPQDLFEHLDRPAIETLVAHEACHFRRRDNLTAALHMLVEALFWFHPMVWWIGGRLVEERERACDEEVVRAGHDRETYATSLVECCRLFLQSPLRCVAGASGSNLTRRVKMIMTLPLRSQLSLSGKSVLIAAGTCAIASPVAAGWLTTPAERQAVSRIVAIASSPGSALLQEPSSATIASDQSAMSRPTAQPQTQPKPPAAVQQIAALRPDQIRLETGAGDPPPAGLARPLLSATTAAIPDERLAPVAAAQAPEAATSRAPGKLWLACKTVRILEPSPHVTHLCLTQGDWDKTLAQVDPAPSGAGQ